MAATGNARGREFSDEPLIRMRNTLVLAGNDKLEDMIASVDDGYYLLSTGNGQADLTGEFTFGINISEIINKLQNIKNEFGNVKEKLSIRQRITEQKCKIIKKRSECTI